MAIPREEAIQAINEAKGDLDRALVELEKMSAVDPDKAIFAAHALNNYLTVVTATLELVTPSLANHPDTQVRAWVERLAHATNLMAYTVNQLLAISSGKVPQLLMHKVDLVALVRKGCNYYQRIAQRKQIHIVFESTVASPYVWADPVVSGAILDNLLSNAVKFSPPGRTIHATLGEEPGHLICSVRDEGPGLSAEDQQKLFQKGARLSAVPTAGEPSSGYGLAVAKEFVDRLGGRIWCDSVLGRGARFSFSLPVYQEHPHPA